VHDELDNASTKRTGTPKEQAERARYKPKRHRRYLRVDPDNRLVADASRLIEHKLCAL